MVLLDAIARRLPGALADGSGEHESFSAALDGGLEYPHYTRPAEYRGWDVPEVLLSGDHGRIEQWRRDQSASGARCRSGIDERDVARGAEDGHAAEPVLRRRGAAEGTRDDVAPARRRRLADDARRDPARRARRGRSGAAPGRRGIEHRAHHRHSRNPVDRLTRGLPDPLRVIVDWAVTIIGAVAIVLLVKAYVVNPYRIPRPRWSRRSTARSRPRAARRASPTASSRTASSTTSATRAAARSSSSRRPTPRA